MRPDPQVHEGDAEALWGALVNTISAVQRARYDLAEGDSGSLLHLERVYMAFLRLIDELYAAGIAATRLRGLWPLPEKSPSGEPISWPLAPNEVERPVEALAA